MAEDVRSVHRKRAPEFDSQRMKLTGVSAPDEAALLDAVGDARWNEFALAFWHVGESLYQAAGAVEILTEALSADDFARLKAAVVRRFDVADAAIDAVADDLDRVTPQLLEDIRARRRELDAELAGIAYVEPDGGDGMFITGEYER